MSITDTTVVVMNLASNVTTEEMKNLFDTVTEGLVKSLTINSEGTVEVVVKSRTDAENVIQLFNGRTIDEKVMKMMIKPPPSLVKVIMPSHGVGGGGSLFTADTTFKNNYVIDFEKISQEINKKNGNFRGVEIKEQYSLQKCSMCNHVFYKDDFIIDESEQEHFTQILFIQQYCYVGSKLARRWGESFTKKYLNDICKNDYEIYLENWDDIGPDFVKQFPAKIEYFIDNFCKTVN